MFFECKFPCDPSDFVHFRKRIGEERLGRIFSYSVNLHGEDVSKQAKFVLSDTMVQGNNTTFSADSKMDKKVIDKCNKVAAKEGISQHSKYLKASTSFRQATMGNIRKRAKQARKAIKRLKTMANIQLRELEKNDRRSKIVLPIRF